ncbi:MAG TPA: hypothetical protein VKT77_18975 [Chthonomonadaceae bacterium]|nr:hypothetical protein [Chthonomonadaceae bacterium]
MESKPKIDAATVLEFVGKAHGDFERVRELLELEPALANACVDWGGGDWESALGAAAHMGRRDIALHLLASGARGDLFAAAMLGHLSIVRAIVEEYPAVAGSCGPHGIPLIAHAQAGGDEAKAVVEYLKSKM